MNASKTFLAPAKINLFMHIVGQREDGYHLLQTAFQFLNIADTLTISPNNSGNITLEPAIKDIPLEQNLIYKSAIALQKATGCKQGAHIHVEKILPMGAGLGGGSSNAATTLVALNELWQLKLSRQQLQNIGQQLGADVPIFIYGQAALAEGIGEQLTDINPPESAYLLAIPNCHVSTKEIFSHSALTRDTKIKKIAAFIDEGTQNLSDLYANDAELLVRSLHKEVDKTFALLTSIGKAQMTGTGACIFVPFASKCAADAAMHQLLESKAFTSSGLQTQFVVCQGKNISPLYNH